MTDLDEDDMDKVLEQCNETELLQIARRNGHILKRGIDRAILIDIVRGAINPKDEHKSGTVFTRKKLEDFISANWARAQSQLPGCNGKCTTFPCTEAKHSRCFAANKNSVM